MLSRIVALCACSLLLVIGCDSSRQGLVVVGADAAVAPDAAPGIAFDYELASRDDQTGDCLRDGSCDGRGGYYCSDYVSCLESDPTSAAVCERECESDWRVCRSSRLRACIRGGGGLACFSRECQFGPDPAALCARRAACVRGGGGYACFRRSC